MVHIRLLEKALWGSAIPLIFSRSTAEAMVGVKIPAVPVDLPRFGPRHANEEFVVEVPVFSDSTTPMMPCNHQRNKKKWPLIVSFDLCTANTHEANLENLKASLGSQWLSDAVKEGGVKSCMEARALTEKCRLAQNALSTLSCSMQEIHQAKEAAVEVETAIMESVRDVRQACSKTLLHLLHYLDLSIFSAPFFLYQQGAPPDRALEAAFVHWGLSRQSSGSGSAAASASEEVPPSHVELRALSSLLVNERLCSLSRALCSVKAGLMLLLLAHLRYEELFIGSSQTPTTRVFPNLVSFLSSSIASQRRQADSLCQVKLSKIRDLPKLPKGYRFIPRLFMIRKVLATGEPKLACDLLDDAINNTQANYEHGLNYINEIMNHLPVERKRQTIPLQKNTSPAINLKRLCFSLSVRRKADILDKAVPCSLNHLDLPQEQRETPSFLQADREAIAKPEATEETSSPRDKNKLEFYFELISNMGSGGSSIGSLLTRFAVQKSDFPLTKDPRTYDEIVSAAQRNAIRCAAIESEAFTQELAKQGEGEELERTLGWLAREEPCAGHHCADWRKLHPYNVMLTYPELYESLSDWSPWIRMMLVFYEWYGLYDVSSQHIQTKDAVSRFNGFQASYMVEGRPDKRGLLQKLLGLKKSKQQLTTMHVRFLMSQLSPEAMFALRSAFRPVVHQNTFHLLNQYAAFMSEPNGALKHKGGVVKQLEGLIEKWTYVGMPPAVQEKRRNGGSPSLEDFKGFSLTEAPPDTNDLNHSVRAAMLAAMEKLSYHPELQEEFWLSCQNPSRVSNSIQLLRDSHHLLTQAGDDLLLVGLVINPQQTTAGMHKNLLDRLLKAVNRAVNKLLRLPAYVLQHATYTVIVPDYARVAVVVKELSRVYSRNPSVFKDVDVFRKAVGSMLDILQNDFFSPTGLPPSVPVTALLNNVDPYYNMLGATQRAAEFRRSIMAAFFAHIWKLVMNLSLDAMVNPKKVQKREKQYSQPVWQRAMMDPLQSNSMRMVIVGGDLGFTVFDKVLSRDQKRMLKNVRFGTGIMFSHNMLLAGRVHAELGYVSYGNFITAQSPFLGKVVIDWLEKRRKDRVREILGWISLALFFAGAVVGIANELNAIAAPDTGVAFSPEAGDLVANQSALAGGGGCGPMGICLEDAVEAPQMAPMTGIDGDMLGQYTPDGDTFFDVPDMSASPALTAVCIVLRTALMVGMSSVLGPFVSIYMIISSHWKFLERLEQVVGNLFRWIVYQVRYGRFGRWYVRMRETKQAKREAKRLAELEGKQTKPGGDEESLGELEGDNDFPKETLAWGTMFEAPSQPKKKQSKGKKFIKKLFSRRSKRKGERKNE
ncbi:hypothetical protein ACSSS7_004730 [Eimeria intestinalis]